MGEEKGFGFIDTDGSSLGFFGEDLFVHCSALMGKDREGRLAPGDVVEFEVGTDSKTGKRCALKVCKVSAHKVIKERVKGECLSWNEEKTFGFIKMEDGDNVYVHSNELQDTDKLEKGDRVEFG